MKRIYYFRDSIRGDRFKREAVSRVRAQRYRDRFRILTSNTKKSFREIIIEMINVMKNMDGSRF